MIRVLIQPFFRAEDQGDGGIRRVVEAQHRWLPAYGVEPVEHVEEADVIALHAGTWIDSRPGVPVVAHCHGLYWEGYSWQRWAHALNKDVIRTLRQADATTAPSDWVAQALRRGMWLDPVVMYHGVDPEDWPVKRSHGEYVLWNKTRIDPVCDPVPVTELAKRASDVMFVTTFADPSGKPSNVAITGVLSYAQGKDLIHGAGVYLATARETFGIGTLEAMCSGVPVLAWGWGGQAEFVGHKQHGYLARPGDYDDLLDGLHYCIEHRNELGPAAREYVLEHFTWEKRIAPYAELYARLVEQSRGRPRVSVVITNYNLGRYLPDAVRSVQEAGLSASQVETLIVDDASTEPLPTEVTELEQDGQLRIVRNPENVYLAEALNVGIQAARGEYVVPLDADNMLAPNALVVLSQALDQDRALDIAYGKMGVIREQEHFVSGWPPAVADLDQQIEHRNQISSTAMYRRKVWERVGGYRRRCHTAEDADFWCRALALGFTGRRVTDAVTLVYRDRSDSMSHVQKDWAWHSWYRWAAQSDTRSFAASGVNIPTHEMPLVSVVIPVGPGHERLVLDALDSMQAQTFRHWEAVVVNDTGAPFRWLHPWARVVDSGRKGAATARNAGLARARAPYVLFLDADDWLHPEALQRMHAVITQCGGFVYSDWFVGETGERKEAPPFVPDDVLRRLPYPVTCLYSVQDLRDHAVKFDPAFDGKGWEDWDFALQVVARAGLCGTRIAAPLFHYRLQTGTLRDRAYVRRDDMKKDIQDKWREYITGGEQNMARGCGSCGGGRVYTPRKATEAAVAAETGTDHVTLEYLPPGTAGTRSFVGRVTGNRYRFGSDAGHRVRKVYAPDADYLLSLGLFRKHMNVDASVEPLAAPGPPRRS